VATHWLIDGMNVIGSRPSGWWRDRPKAMRELVEELEALLTARSGDEITVVFDGGPFDIPSTEVDVLFASRRGRDAADDDIAQLAGPGRTVVTSDADLAERSRAKGARVEGAGAFRRLLDGSAEPEPG
jgi:predicted RNA-binding protein with PIN domain